MRCASSASARPLRSAVSGAKGAPKDAMRVRVRKKLGLDVIGRAVKGETPREITLLVAASADAPFELRGKGVPKRADLGVPPPILRVDLDVPEAKTAVLEVLRPTPGWRAERVFLERGIRLAAYT